MPKYQVTAELRYRQYIEADSAREAHDMFWRNLDTNDFAGFHSECKEAETEDSDNA